MLKAARWTVIGLLGASILILAFAVGYIVRGGGSSSAAAPPSQAAGNATSTAKLNFNELNQIYQLLQQKYVDPTLVDEQTLYQAAITGMLQTFPDSGTFYVDPNTVQTSVGPSGTFQGIGATVASQNGKIVITAPIDNTPAQRAGIRAGDIIEEVDGVSTAGWTQEKAVLKIRGPKGTTVKLKVKHTDGTEQTLSIQRDDIKVASVTTVPPGGTLKDGSGKEITDIGYIHIREFTEQTEGEMQTALKAILSSGKKGVILDLRNNPGGLLRTTANVANDFLDSGKLILTEQERDGTKQEFRAQSGGIATKLPVVIILNRFSASGSEVLSAALHDNGRATIVGEKSFGKGTVNISNNLQDGGQLYISIAKWFTPNGTQIDGVGIRPDIAVTPSNSDIDANRDVQLFKAIDVLEGTNTTPPEALTPQPQTPTPARNATPTRVGG